MRFGRGGCADRPNYTEMSRWDQEDSHQRNSGIAAGSPHPPCPGGTIFSPSGQVWNPSARGYDEFRCLELIAGGRSQMEQLMINLAGIGRALGAGMALAWLSWGWGWTGAQDQKPAEANASTDASDPTAAARNRMVQRHLAERGIKNPRVLEAFRTVPRHRFLPPKTQRQAYDDESIPIGEGQTITPPYDVAFMTEVLDPKPTDKVYEVGTGSGYQAAILSRLVKEVYSVEIHAPLSERATGVHKDARLHQHSHPGRRRLRGLARGRALRRDHRHLRPAPDSPATGRPAQGGGPDGHSPGRPVHPERAPGHQAGRQADRPGAQADPFRADDRQGPEGRAGAQDRWRAGPRPGHG